MKRAGNKKKRAEFKKRASSEKEFRAEQQKEVLSISSDCCFVHLVIQTG